MGERERLEWAWAAGLFEGEGSIGLTGRRTHHPTLCLQLSMVDGDIVRRFANVVGGSVSGPYVHRPPPGANPRQPIWRWSISGQPARAVLQRLWPILGPRRQAKAVTLGFPPIGYNPLTQRIELGGLKK